MTTGTETLTPSKTARSMRKSTIPFGYIVAALVVAGLVVVFVATASGGRYELDVSQVATAPEKFDGKNLRVRGQIKEGSIVATSEGGRPLTRFVLIDESGHELPIVSRESPPDNFEGGKSCIVEGKYTKTGEHGEVESTRLTMKCPSKYEAEGGAGKGADDLYQRYKQAPADPNAGPKS